MNCDRQNVSPLMFRHWTFSYLHYHYLCYRVHRSTLPANTNSMQIWYKQKAHVGKDRQLTGFLGFFTFLPPSLSPNPHLPLKMNIHIRFKAFKGISQESRGVKPQFLTYMFSIFVATTNTGWTKWKQETGLMMLACWWLFLLAISFHGGYATPHPPRGPGLLGCQVQVGMGLLGDSVWADSNMGLFQHAQVEKVQLMVEVVCKQQGVSTVIYEVGVFMSGLFVNVS